MNYARLHATMRNGDSFILYYAGGDQERRVHFYRSIEVGVTVHIPFDYSLEDRDEAKRLTKST